MLAEANTIQKAKELKSMALTAAEWAKQKNMGKDTILHCMSYALEAERKMGQMLKKTERAKGELKRGPVVTSCDRGEAPTLEELGLTKRESAEAQELAVLPEEEFQAVTAGKQTRSRALKVAKRRKKKAAHTRKVKEAADHPKAPAVGPFDLILADPPWKYDHCESGNREIENQYPTATVEDICSHGPDARKNSILFLWATAPKLEEAFKVMNAWGFTYRTCAVWDKQKIGMGYWFRGAHELILVGVKGKPECTPESARISSIFSEKRGRHSAKPECVYAWIEMAFPGVDKLEMYCRKPRLGWASHGNEV